MTARASAVEQTRRRVLEATVALHLRRLSADISLIDVAEEAQVSVQTVLRHFGSRDGLLRRPCSGRPTTSSRSDGWSRVT